MRMPRRSTTHLAPGVQKTKWSAWFNRRQRNRLVKRRGSCATASPAWDVERPSTGATWQARSQGPKVPQRCQLPPPQDKQANAAVKVKRAPQKKPQVVPEGRAGEYTSQLPRILNMDSSNTCLGGHPIPAGLQQKLAAYEKRTNNLEEQLVDLAAKFVRLESENQSMCTWYTGRIISVWEGLQHLGERTTRSIGSMVQVVGDDNAKHKRLAELMEETHLCLGIPYTPHQGPLCPATTRLPSVDIEPPAKSSNLPPPQEFPTSAAPAEPVVGATDEWDMDLPLPPPATPRTPRTITPCVMGAGGPSKRALSAILEDADDGDQSKKQRL